MNSESILSRAQVFMRFALDLARLSKCDERHVAAVITDRDLSQVYSVGLNGGPKGLADCMCKMSKERYGCVHAEMNALNKCLSDAADKVMFITLSPCISCAASIINAPGSFSTVYYAEAWKSDAGINLLKAAGISVIHLQQHQDSLNNSVSMP